MQTFSFNYLIISFQDKATVFAPLNYYNKGIQCTYLLTHCDKLGGIELGNNTLQNLQSTNKTSKQTDTHTCTCIR